MLTCAACMRWRITPVSVASSVAARSRYAVASAAAAVRVVQFRSLERVSRPKRSSAKEDAATGGSDTYTAPPEYSKWHPEKMRLGSRISSADGGIAKTVSWSISAGSLDRLIVDESPDHNGA